jgi:hypothetical protein
MFAAFFLGFLTTENGEEIDRPETSENNYQSALRNRAA